MATHAYTIDKRDLAIIAAIAVCSLLLRFLFFLDYKNTVFYPLLPYSDGYSYFLWAKDIASGDMLGQEAFMKWPLYAYFVGSLFKAYGSSITLVYLLQFVLGAINCMLVYLIARVLFNRAVGFIAGMLCLWYGLFLFYDGLLIYTSLSICLNLFLFLYLLHIKEQPSRKSLFFCGLLLGICTITQANIVIFGLTAICWMLWQRKREVARGLCFFLIGLLLVVGSVTLRNYLVEKRFVLIAGNIGFNFYSGNNPDATGTFYCPTEITLNQDDMFRDARIIAEASVGRRLGTSEVSDFWLAKARDFIRHRPGDFTKLLFKKVILVFSPAEHIHEMEYYFLADKIRVFKILFLDLKLILPLALVGMVVSLLRFKETVFLYFAVMGLSLSIALFFVATRYRMTAVPFLAIFAAAAIVFVWDAFWQRRYLKFAAACSVLIAILALLNLSRVLIDPRGGLEDSVNALEHHLSKASLYENLTRYEEARRELESASRIQPNNKRVLFRLAILRYNMGNIVDAQEQFRKIIELCPLCVDAYYNLGLLYNQGKRFREARELLERAVSLDPEDAGAHFELATAYKSLGESEKARFEFEASLKRISRWRIQERSLIERELQELF